MNAIYPEDLKKVENKLKEFMKYCQKLEVTDTYLVVNRNSPVLAKTAMLAAEKYGLNVKKFDLLAKKPYKNFPKQLINLLYKEVPKAGMGLFNYSQNPDWNLKEVGARIKFLHQVIEKLPISWAHSPGITLDMAINGPLQCDYKQMVKNANRLLQKMQNIDIIQITAPAGTNIEIEIAKQMKFDTDCILVPPNIYGKPGKFGNIPVGEVWTQKSQIIEVINKKTGKRENQHYPIKQIANGKVVCDVTVGGYPGKINPEKPIIVQFKDGLLIDFRCEDQGLSCIREDILTSQNNYGLPTVLEEVGIGLNEKARITGNMLEDEKIKGTCHLAPGNVRSHVDMLVSQPTITVFYNDGKVKDIMRKGSLV